MNKKVKFAIDFSVINFEYNFCVNINYFFDIITIYKEDFIKYKNKITKKTKNLNEADKQDEKTPKDKAKKQNSLRKIQNYKWIFEYIEVDRINLDIKVGLEDVFITSMVIPILSTILSIVLQKYFSPSIKRFSIKPVYNELFFNLKGATYVSIKLKDIIYIIFKMKYFTNKK